MTADSEIGAQYLNFFSGQILYIFPRFCALTSKFAGHTTL